MNKEEMLIIAAQVDWEALEKMISDLIKIPVKMDWGVVKCVDGNYTILGESQELFGCMEVTMSDIVSVSLLSWFLVTEDGLVSGEVYYMWKYEAFGSNGCRMRYVSYNFKTQEWTAERQKK